MAPRGVQRRLAAILAADVVGYTRLMSVDETGTLTRLKAHRQEHIDQIIAAHHGRIVKLMGDGILVEFASAVDALECALAWQRGIEERNQNVPQGRRITFRIGINVGDIIIDDGDIYGDGVNIAARLEPLAQPGGITVSRTVYDHVKNKVDIGFEPLGDQLVKNISDPIQVYRVQLATAETQAPTAGPAYPHTQAHAYGRSRPQSHPQAHPHAHSQAHPHAQAWRRPAQRTSSFLESRTTLLAAGGLAAFLLVSGVVYGLWPADEPSEVGGGRQTVDSLSAAFALGLEVDGCGSAVQSRDANNRLNMTGFVPRGTQSATLERAVASARELPQIDLRVIELNDTICEVVRLVSTETVRLDPARRIELRDQDDRTKEIFKDQDYLVVDVPPTTKDAYVWIDYFVHDGQVLHMLPHEGSPNNFTLAGSRLLVGDPDAGGQVWQIGPPFGRDLLVVFKADYGFQRPARPEVEPISEYLAYLRQRLAGSDDQGVIQADFRVIQTEPR